MDILRHGKDFDHHDSNIKSHHPQIRRQSYILYPEKRPISQEQLLTESKEMDAGLVIANLTSYSPLSASGTTIGAAQQIMASFNHSSRKSYA
jgi:hypothetical protein